MQQNLRWRGMRMMGCRGGRRWHAIRDSEGHRSQAAAAGTGSGGERQLAGTRPGADERRWAAGRDALGENTTHRPDGGGGDERGGCGVDASFGETVAVGYPAAVTL